MRFVPSEQGRMLCDRNRRRGRSAQHRALPTGTDVKRSAAVFKGWARTMPCTRYPARSNPRGIAPSREGVVAVRSVSGPRSDRIRPTPLRPTKGWS